MVNYKSKIYYLYESEAVSMNFINKLERRFGKYCIQNLMLYIVFGQALVLICSLLMGNNSLLNLIYFNPFLIAKGQIWRLVSFVFIPNTTQMIWFLFAAFLYYSIGNTLEHVWGSFRFNLYYLLGMIFNMLGLWLIQVIFHLGWDFYYSYSLSITFYLNLSLFLAYAVLFPDVQFLLYMIIPVKVKYLAAFDMAFIIYQFLIGNVANRMLIIMSLLNFFLFFGPHLLGKGGKTKTQRQFHAAQKQRRKGTLKQGDPIPVAFHKCTVCGKTELTDPDMEFRYCSKCNGAHEYCMDHLHHHEHIT